MVVAASAPPNGRNGRNFCVDCFAAYGMKVELPSRDDESRLAALRTI